MIILTLMEQQIVEENNITRIEFNIHSLSRPKQGVNKIGIDVEIIVGWDRNMLDHAEFVGAWNKLHAAVMFIDGLKGCPAIDVP